MSSVGGGHEIDCLILRFDDGFMSDIAPSLVKLGYKRLHLLGGISTINIKSTNLLVYFTIKASLQPIPTSRCNFFPSLLLLLLP